MENGDFALLNDTRHMFEWFFETPYKDIWTEVQTILQNQVPGAELRKFTVTAEPDWLTTGKTNPEDESKMIVTMAGFAFAFTLDVFAPERGVDTLQGVFSYAGANLDGPSEARQTQLWLDIGGTLDEFGSAGRLEDRLRTLSK